MIWRVHLTRSHVHDTLTTVVVHNEDFFDYFDKVAATRSGVSHQMPSERVQLSSVQERERAPGCRKPVGRWYMAWQVRKMTMDLDHGWVHLGWRESVCCCAAQTASLSPMVAGLGRPTPDHLTRVQTNDQGRLDEETDLCECARIACQSQRARRWYFMVRGKTIGSVPWLRRASKGRRTNKECCSGGTLVDRLMSMTRMDEVDTRTDGRYLIGKD